MIFALRHSAALARPRILSSVARVGATRTNMYQPLEHNVADIDKIFDAIDTDGNGSISREEFHDALEQLNFYDLVKIHNVAQVNMEKKMQALDRIQDATEELEKIHVEKQQAYSNVGMMTGAEIDALFDKSKRQKLEVAESVSELRSLLGQVRDLLGGGK